MAASTVATMGSGGGVVDGGSGGSNGGNCGDVPFPHKYYVNGIDKNRTAKRIASKNPFSRNNSLDIIRHVRAIYIYI